MFITPEDIIIAKLVAFSNTGSDKHLRDARGILVTLWEQLDLDKIKADASSVHLNEQLENLLKSVSWDAEK